MTDYAELEKRLRAKAAFIDGVVRYGNAAFAQKDDANALTEAADAIAALTTQLEEAADDHDKLQRVRQWAEAYPEDIFRPVTNDDLKRADALLREAGISMSAMHGHWARHIVCGIGSIVGARLSTAPAEQVQGQGEK